jgi:hypothetical protein
MLKLFGFFILALASLPVCALGETGHRVTGAIAENYLTEQTKAALVNILGTESLAEISTYADEMRSSPEHFWQKVASPYHYVTVPKGKNYEDVGIPKQGDAFWALNMYSKMVNNPKSTPADKVLAIKMIVHLIGDLHQPLHVGNGLDRGGNSVKLKYFNRTTNLHSVWDSKMIDDTKLSFTELTLWLNEKITKDHLKAWSNIDPLIWIKESAEMRETIYPKDLADPSLGYKYKYEQLPKLKVQLQKSGVRIAAYLNNLLKKKD